MLKVCLFGLGTYIIGILSLMLRIKIEMRDNPDFASEFMDAYFARNDDEDCIGNNAPYIGAIIPGLNFVLGSILLTVSLSNECWALLKEKMLDKK